MVVVDCNCGIGRDSGKSVSYVADIVLMGYGRGMNGLLRVIGVVGIGYCDGDVELFFMISCVGDYRFGVVVQSVVFQVILAVVAVVAFSSFAVVGAVVVVAF